MCEALIDALTFWCAGYRNVTASYGVEGFTADHLALFKTCGVQRVLIAYDRDEAGERAAQKLAQQLLAEGLDCYRIHFPKGMDANEYALKVGPAPKSLGVVIRSAQWLGRGTPHPITTTAATSTESAISTITTEPAMSPSTRSDAPLPSVAAEEAAKGETNTESPTPAKSPLSPELSDAALVLDAIPAQVIPEGPVELPPPSGQALGAEREHVFTFGQRRYRVRGLEKNLSLQMLKINLLVSGASPDLMHVDTLDLYSARSRTSYIAQAAGELRVKEDLIKADLARLLLQCESLQEQAMRAALELLKSPDLLTRIADDLRRVGSWVSAPMRWSAICRQSRASSIGLWRC